MLRAREDPERFMRVFERAYVPAGLVDDERRNVAVNRPARLLFRQAVAADVLVEVLQNVPGAMRAWNGGLEHLDLILELISVNGACFAVNP